MSKNRLKSDFFPRETLEKQHFFTFFDFLLSNPLEEIRKVSKNSTLSLFELSRVKKACLWAIRGPGSYLDAGESTNLSLLTVYKPLDRASRRFPGWPAARKTHPAPASRGGPSLAVGAIAHTPINSHSIKKHRISSHWTLGSRIYRAQRLQRK